MRWGAAKSAAGRASGMVEIELPLKDEEISAQTFSFRVKKEKLAEAELFDGHYLLRSNLSDKEPEWLWKLYMLLVQMLDVEIPTTDGRLLQLTRYTQPDKTVELLLQRLGKSLPEQPPPKLISREKMELPRGGCVVKTFGAASLKNRRILRVSQ